jgi:hypothetical protein
VFEKHLSPWIGHFFTDLEESAAAAFYRWVGALGPVFTEVDSRSGRASKWPPRPCAFGHTHLRGRGQFTGVFAIVDVDLGLALT